MQKGQRASTLADEVAVQLGRDLERWRVESGLTQRDLSEIGKVSQGQISRILDGRATVVTPTVRRLTKAAGINVERLAVSNATANLRSQLHAELDRVWDGSEIQAQALTALLRATRSLVSPPARRR